MKTPNAMPTGRGRNYRHTKRWLNRANWYEDTERERFVVFRRAGKVERRTSVRYSDSASRREARGIAEREAERLKNWPAHLLAKFQWAPE